MATKIQLRRDTSTNWTSNNPILLSGEIGFETDTRKIKIGDGASNWQTLQYVSGYGATVPGSSTEIIYNDAGSFAANNRLTFSDGTVTVTGNVIVTHTLNVANVDITDIATFTSTEHLILPKGTTAQQTATTQGSFRYNTTINAIEWYNGSSWDSVKSSFSSSNGVVYNSTTGNIFAFGANGILVTTDGINIQSGNNYITANSTGLWYTGPLPEFTLSQPGGTIYSSEAGSGGTFSNFFVGKSAGSSVSSGGNHNTFIGQYSGCSSTTGIHNTFIGQYSGCSVTTGSHNIFVGKYSGCSSTTGSSNIFIGELTGKKNTTGYHNIFIGKFSGANTTIAHSNILLGNRTGQSITTGVHNVFIGSTSGNNATTANNNVFLGQSTGLSVTTGSYNTFIGKYAGCAVTTGVNNTFIGNKAGLSVTTSSDNFFVGKYAGCSVATVDSWNIFIGKYVGCSVTTGNRNFFAGKYTGFKTTTGCNNVFIGDCVGCTQTAGRNNIAIGFKALLCNVIGNHNTVMGYYAGQRNTSDGNIYIGFRAGGSFTSGQCNVFLGHYAGTGCISTSCYNIAIGPFAGRSAAGGANGNYNVFLGRCAGRCFTTACNNTFFGHRTGFRTTTGSHNIFVGSCSGANATITTDNVFLGNKTGLAVTTGCYNFFAGKYAGCAVTTGCCNIIIGSYVGTTGLLNTIYLQAGTNTLKVDGTGLEINGTSIKDANGILLTTDGFNVRPGNTQLIANTTGLWIDNSGSGSGLNADLLDGIDSNSFIRSDVDDIVTAITRWEGTAPEIRFHETDTTTYSRLIESAATLYIQSGAPGAGATTSSGTIRLTGWNSANVGSVVIRHNNNYREVLTTHNLHDLIDKTADITGTTEFVLSEGTTHADNIGYRKAASEIKLSAFNNDIGANGIIVTTDGINVRPGNTLLIANTTGLWIDNSGSGSGLNADLLDGIDSENFLRTDIQDTVGAVTTWATINPQIKFHETDTTTYARFVETGSIFYIQSGASGVGESTSPGTIRLQGYFGANVASATIKHNSGDREILTTHNLHDLIDKTADITGTTEFVLSEGTTHADNIGYRKAANEIKLSAFNNDIGANGILVTTDGINVLAGNTLLIANTTGLWINASTLDNYLSTTVKTLTNKTINGDNNTLSNLDIGNEVDWAVADDVANRGNFEAGDKLLIFENGLGLRKIDYTDLPGAGGFVSASSGLDNRVAVFSTTSNIEGDEDFRWESTSKTLTVNGSIQITGNPSDIGNNGDIVFNNSGKLNANSNMTYTNGGLQVRTPTFFLNHTDTQSGSTITFDFANGNILQTTLTANVSTININNTKPNGIYELWITQNDTNVCTFSGWNSYAWHTSDGNPKGVTTTLNGMTIYQLRVNSANTFISVQNGV